MPQDKLGLPWWDEDKLAETLDALRKIPPVAANRLKVVKVECQRCKKRLSADCPRMATEWGGKWAGSNEKQFDNWYCADGEEKK